MWRRTSRAHNQLMFYNLQLHATLTADRQTLLRGAAARHRLVRRNRAPAAAPPGAILSVVWPDDPDYLRSHESVHCVA